MQILHPLAPVLLALCACANTLESTGPRDNPVAARFLPDLPVSQPPYSTLTASWKDRLEVPYAFLEARGPYHEAGASIPSLLRELDAQGLSPDGPPFCLFFDDPGRVRAEDLRARVCVPLRGVRSLRSPLRLELLPSQTVAYAYASGPYPEVPRAYPKVFEYLAGMGWEPAGPVREIYLVAPGPRPDPSQLLTEIQVPVRAAR